MPTNVSDQGLLNTKNICILSIQHKRMKVKYLDKITGSFLLIIYIRVYIQYIIISLLNNHTAIIYTQHPNTYLFHPS